MSIWIAGAAVLMFMAFSSVWKYSFLAIFILLFVGSELMGPTAWVAGPQAGEPPDVPPVFIFFTLAMLSLAVESGRFHAGDKVVRFVLGCSCLLGILLYGLAFPFIVEQSVLLYSLLTLSLFLGLPFCGLSILNRVRGRE